MTDAEFAAAFEDLFRGTYVRAARRVRDKRERLTPETVACLDHLATMPAWKGHPEVLARDQRRLIDEGEDQSRLYLKTSSSG